jgi:hypothetical protein
MTRNQRRRSSDIPSEVKLRKVVPEVAGEAVGF